MDFSFVNEGDDRLVYDDKVHQWKQAFMVNTVDMFKLKVYALLSQFRENWHVFIQLTQIKSRKTPLANFASAFPVKINQSLDGSKQLFVRVECRKLIENISHHLIDFHSEGYRVFLLSIDAHILVLICFCTSSKCFVYLRKRNFHVRVQCLNKDVGSASSSMAGLLIRRRGVLRRLHQTNRLLQ